MADGKLILGKPSMVSLTHFPYFYTLHGPAHGEQYRDDYERGRLSRATKRIMDTLAERRPQTTKELKRSTRLEAAKSRPIFDQAMAELQRKLHLTMVEARYEPTFTYVWDLPEVWLPEPVACGREIRLHEAIYQLTRHYLSVVYYASLARIERVAASPRAEVETAVAQLQQEGTIEIDAPIAELPRRWLVWKG